MGFLKVWISVHTRLAAKKHLADGQFLKVAVNTEEFLKLRERNQISVISKT
jgi:hypothetical protein